MKLNISNNDVYVIKSGTIGGYLTIKYNFPVTSCEEMIKEKCGCEIDMSNFNSSQVTSINIMFFNCSGKTSINMPNLDISKIFQWIVLLPIIKT